MPRNMNSKKIKWLKEPQEHDYPASRSYLMLTMSVEAAISTVKQLQAASVETFKAKDIFRASGLSLLGVSNSHVKKNTKKVNAGTALSPILLVRDGQRVIIADGYHRLCAVYGFNEDAEIPCKLV